MVDDAKYEELVAAANAIDDKTGTYECFMLQKTI